MKSTVPSVTGALLALSGFTVAQSVCPTSVQTKVPAPSTAPGWEARLAGTGLTYPRGIKFDTAGNLLVVDRGVGIKALTLQDDGGTCVTVSSVKVVIADTTLNHGIDLMDDGKTLLASSSVSLFSWTYDAATMSNTTAPRTLVTNMDNADHDTRTVIASAFKPGTVIINRGSSANIDNKASTKSTGHAQVKSFPVGSLAADANPYDFASQGRLLAWGVRNDVGVTEHPVTGGIFTVENSVDNISRNGTQFNANNPGEKLNYMGTLVSNSSPNQGSNFGYPQCFAAWAPKKVPNHGNLKVGQQFSIDSSISDAQCQNQRTAPELVFDAHMAPLDIKFRKGGDNAFVSFHGSL